MRAATSLSPRHIDSSSRSVDRSMPAKDFIHLRIFFSLVSPFPMSRNPVTENDQKQDRSSEFFSLLSPSSSLPSHLTRSRMRLGFFFFLFSSVPCCKTWSRAAEMSRGLRRWMVCWPQCGNKRHNCRSAVKFSYGALGIPCGIATLIRFRSRCSRGVNREIHRDSCHLFVVSLPSSSVSPDH